MERVKDKEVTDKVQARSASQFNSSPIKKTRPTLLDVETDRMWGQVLNEDYRKFRMETELEKVKAVRKKHELQEFLKNQILIQQREKEQLRQQN